MYKALVLIVSTVLIPQALAAQAVCSPGDLAIGTDDIGPPSHEPTPKATLWDNNCNILDSIQTSSNICGSYDGGSTVICSVGTETPASAQTANGFDFGNCVRVNDEQCFPAGTINFCCSPA